MALMEIHSTSTGNGKPLVLLHPFPLSGTFWGGIQVPAGYSLVAPDFPGFGNSPLPSHPFTLTDAAKSLQKHLIDKGLRGSYALGGISMGGYWALECFRLFSEPIEKMVLISTRAVQDSPEARQNRLAMAEKVAREGTGYLVSAMLPGLLGKTSLAQKPQVAEKVGRWIREAPPQAVAFAQRAMAERRDQSPLLPSWKVPVLVMAGREDALIPFSEGSQMASAFPNARLELLGGVGHLLPVEDPAAFEKNLWPFLAEPAS
jgi:pimeloyl-ACP methyl ester carboxylesterase